MQEADIRAPLVYVMGRNIKAEEAFTVFSITPCFTAVVSTHADHQIVQQYVQEVLKAEDDSVSQELATHVARTTGKPVLTLCDGAGMSALYSDGEKEDLCLSKLTSMS